VPRTYETSPKIFKSIKSLHISEVEFINEANLTPVINTQAPSNHPWLIHDYLPANYSTRDLQTLAPFAVRVKSRTNPKSTLEP
jgi:hypothetical protein